MTTKELQEKIKEFGYTAESLKKKPMDYMSLVFFASHFYSMGFSEAVTNITDSFDIVDYIMP